MGNKNVEVAVLRYVFLTTLLLFCINYGSALICDVTSFMLTCFETGQSNLWPRVFMGPKYLLECLNV